ncbi:MAG: hypothetical protein COV72_03975 [Candidatus Omnitrophica bacterium CG11_big_fil_rev_8_21_14_0_20_42_13]|uniref:Uncharacterized protein n=1 Tax=Candidatus Ghiorseimicrobium undicola TaxID=1974746 RepID=A0A2H0LXZ9_9BACT|nr:MAG: hypothetical protein COV72_03975 [Candidatus Omnitrophica bacterium CG11_big_fil_rev_8_21_14_0_20_42_13]
MAYIHKELASGRWHELSFFAQMANIGSEVERAIRWKNKRCLKELARVRKVMCDYFAFDNQYHSTDKSWQNYFYAFNFAARSAT